MYKELVERLRKCFDKGVYLPSDILQAADAIETTGKLEHENLMLRIELDRLKRERDQAVENLKAYEDIGLDPEEIKEILNAVNGGLAAKNGIWCPKCGDALDIDIVNGVLAIGCFGCGEYTPVSELMKLHLNDAVPVVRCKDCVFAEERYGHLSCMNGISYQNSWNKPDSFCSYGERKESNE